MEVDGDAALTSGGENARERMLDCTNTKRVLLKMLSNKDQYFSDGYLNSEGVKLLNIALRLALEECPEYIIYLKKLRKLKSYESFVNILSFLY